MGGGCGSTPQRQTSVDAALAIEIALSGSSSSEIDILHKEVPMEKSCAIRRTEKTEWFYQLQLKASFVILATAAALVFGSGPVGLFA